VNHNWTRSQFKVLQCRAAREIRRSQPSNTTTDLSSKVRKCWDMRGSSTRSKQESIPGVNRDPEHHASKRTARTETAPQRRGRYEMAYEA
jgi:hypothetical protein